MRSVVVVLPASIWAMIPIFLVFSRENLRVMSVCFLLLVLTAACVLIKIQTSRPVPPLAHRIFSLTFIILLPPASGLSLTSGSGQRPCLPEPYGRYRPSSSRPTLDCPRRRDTRWRAVPPSSSRGARGRKRQSSESPACAPVAWEPLWVPGRLHRRPGGT